MKLKPKLPKGMSEAERRYWVCMSHDTRITTTFVVCGTCGKKSEIKEQLTWTQEAISDEDAREFFTKKGWHVGRGHSRNTTRCPKHNKRNKNVSRSRR